MWHPLELLQLVFVVLIVVIIVAAMTTEAHPRTARQWTMVWALIVFLAWALLGMAWIRAAV
jgi:hypothetical protein